MAYSFQVTIDCSDPHVLAAWWAQALGWTVEGSDEDFIRRMISEGLATEADTRTYRGTLVWKEGAAITHPDGVGSAPRVLFQLVPEPKIVKNRLHLDVRLGPDDVEARLAVLVAAGATELSRGRQGPHAWITLADPEGNEFCVSH